VAKLAGVVVIEYHFPVSSAAIIEEIKHLPPAEQAEVIRFAIQLAQTRPLAPAELTALAERLSRTTDPAEAEKLKSAIAGGFYGGSAHA